MKIIEIGTGYTSIPASIGAATEIVIENLIKGFNQIGVRNELIDISYTEKNMSSHNNDLKTTVHLIKVPKRLGAISDNSFIHIFRRIVYSIKVGLFLRKYLIQQHEEIILHFHNQFNFFFTYFLIKSRLREKKINTIYTIHSPGWSVFRKIPTNLLLEKFSILKADSVIALTEIIKKKIVNLLGGIDDKIAVIPNGVSTAIYKPLVNTIKENRILNIGSICERKNQLETIKNLKEILLEKNFQFVFAGKIIENAYFERIKQYVDENNLNKHVLYMGEIQPGIKLNELYNSSKFFVSNSKHEAFISLVILESMAAGLPVFLSESFNTFIDKSSSIYSTVKIFSEDDIEKKLLDFIESDTDYSNYRQLQLDCVLKHYTWFIIATKIKQLINSL